MPDTIELAKYYESLSDSELLNLKQGRGFTEEAERVLAEELARRNLDEDELQKYEAEGKPGTTSGPIAWARRTEAGITALASTKWFALGGPPAERVRRMPLLSLLTLTVSGALSIVLVEVQAYWHTRSLLLPNGSSSGFENLPFAFLGFGASLGLTLALYFVVIEGQRSLPGIAILVFACTVAFPVSIISGIFSGPLLGARISMGSSDLPLQIYFIPGWVGAVIVLGGAMIAFVPNFRPGAFRRVLLWSIGAGGLAVLEELALSASSSDQKRLFDLRQMAPWAVWPSGVAFLLGLLLHFERNRRDESSTGAAREQA